MEGDREKRFKVLIVDDVPENIHILMETLKDEFSLVAATGGEKALRLARGEAPPDLILLDVMLPERRGSDILEALRTKERDLIPHTKVLVLTNFEQDEESRMAMEHHADGYLIKADITPRKLLEVIQEIDDGKKVDLTEN